jgi:hypothetical protein
MSITLSHFSPSSWSCSTNPGRFSSGDEGPGTATGWSTNGCGSSAGGSGGGDGDERSGTATDWSTIDCGSEDGGSGDDDVGDSSEPPTMNWLSKCPCELTVSTWLPTDPNRRAQSSTSSLDDAVNVGLERSLRRTAQPPEATGSTIKTLIDGCPNPR